MICPPCRSGGDANKVGRLEDASRFHWRCKGCPCQHDVGGEWVNHGNARS